MLQSIPTQQTPLRSRSRRKDLQLHAEPNEFVITGTFKDWNRWNDLPKIKTPTLVIGVRYDEMNPKVKRWAILVNRNFRVPL